MRVTGEAGNKIKVKTSHFDTIIRILIFIALAGGTTIAIRPLQLTLHDRIEKTRDEFIGMAEDYLGRKIRYGSIGPSIFGVFDIRNVFILREDGSALLNISRIRISYSFAGLLTGKGMDAFRALRIDRPVLSLDFEKDADLRERFAAPHAQRAAPAVQVEKGRRGNFLPDNFTLRIWDGEWVLSGEAGRHKISGVGLDASVRQGRVVFQGRWNAETSILNTIMTGRINGEYSETSETGSATVRIPSCHGANFRLKPLTMSFFLAESKLEIRKTHDISPVAISLVYDFRNLRLRGRFEGENFPLDDLLVFTGAWNDYNFAPGIKISGDAEFVNEGPGMLDYVINLAGENTEAAAYGSAELIIKASGNANQLKVDDLYLNSGFGGIHFRGGADFNRAEGGAMIFYPAAPYGTLSLSKLSLGKGRGIQRKPGISGDISINTNDRTISLFGENISAGTTTLSAMNASFDQEKEGLVFAFSAHRLDESEATHTGAVSLEGYADYNPRNVQASLRLDSFSAGDILSFAEALALPEAIPSAARYAADNLSVTAEVFFNTDFEHLLYHVPEIAVDYEGYGNILAAVSLSGTDRGFELSEGRISWGKESADVSCSADFSNPDDISFSLTAARKELNYFFEGTIMDRHTISIRGSYEFQVFLSAGRTGGFSGYAQGENIPFASGDRPASLSFLSSISYVSPASWQAEIEKFEITGIAAPASSYASIRFTGSADENGLIIPNILYDDGRGTLEGVVSFEWDPSYSYCGFSAHIFGNSRDEYYGVGGMYRDKTLELSLTGAGMQLSRISGQNAVAGGKLNLSWESLSAFQAEAELSSLVIYREDGEIRASAAADVNGEVFSLRQLTVNYRGLETSLPYLRISRKDAAAETEARVRGSLSGRPVDFSMRGEARFESRGAPAAGGTWLDAYRDFTALDGSFFIETARYDAVEAPEPFVLTFACLREKRGFSLTAGGGPGNMFRFRYAPDGAGAAFYAALSAPSPVRGSLTGTIVSNNIDAQGTDIYVDMGSLWRFIPPEAADTVAFPGGIVTGAVRVAGPLEDPEFYGTLKAASLQIAVPEFLPEPVRPAPVTVSLAGTEITFGPADAVVGSGGGWAVGWFRVDRWIPDTFVIDIHVPPDTPIPHDFAVAGVVARGLVSGSLTLTMEDMVFTVSGDLTAHNTEISLNTAERESAADAEPRSVTTVTDISIRSGRRVEFFWPSADLPVLQAYADMGTGIRLTSDNSSKRFTLAGDVKLRSGEIFYLERNFYIREGALSFNENEAQFDPRISARADLRDLTENGPVTVSMIIDSAPLMSFTPRFVSDPPLSQLEIYALLGQNPEGAAGLRNPATSAAIDSLAQFTVIRRLQRVVRDLLGLDMFSVRTQILQNVVLQGSNRSRVTGNITERSGRPGNYFDNTTVFIGKYFASEIFGEAMLSFKYDENKISWGGLALEPEIGLELRNPLFDIRLSMAPLHPENWFISDTSISVIWRRTFR